MNKKIEAAFELVREKALGTRIPYKNEKILELVGMLEGYTGPQVYYMGSEYIGRTIMERDYVYVEGDNRGCVIEHFKKDEEHDINETFDILNFSLDPLKLLKHYSTGYRDPIFFNKMGEVSPGGNIDLEDMDKNLMMILHLEPKSLDN